MSHHKKQPTAAEAIDALIKPYPSKVARKRAKHMLAVDPSQPVPATEANVRTVPGIITQRGCSYAGCKGVVLGPTRDIINITHGPIGCAFYSWLTRRNQTRTESDTDENFIPYCFSTDMTDNEIIFGGEKKLKAAIQEAYDLFHPKAIAVFSTCPVGLIGDDVHAVAREMKATLGINVFGFSCEGYRGVSQSAGHHIANNQVFKHVVGLDDTPVEGKFKVNLLGEYNIGGDAFVLEEMFEKVGITLVTTFSGNSTYTAFTKAQSADLNMIMCHRSINYMAEMMEKKFGIPWIKVNFTGAESTAKSLRKVAEFFGDKDLTAKVENYLAAELAKIDQVIAEIKPRTKDKTAMIFVGGSRAHHYQDLFKDIGMKTIAAGYEFAHRDDYEGRKVLGTIEVDADSRNIEELHVEKDEARYKKTHAEKKELMIAKGFTFSDYEGMITEMSEGAISIDDISHYEQEKLLELYKPDIFCAGIKEKYGIQKHGIPCKQLHSYDYGGPYAGFKGAVNFYKDIDQMVNSDVWKNVKAPWEVDQTEPQIEATLASA